MTWLLIVGLVVLVPLLILLLDLFVLHRGVRIVGEDGIPFWIRPRSWWNIIFGHEGFSAVPTCHYRLRSTTERVLPQFVAHEWRHTKQQRGDVPEVHEGGLVSWFWHYMTDAPFAAAAEADAVAFGAANATNPFYIAIADRVNKELGV